MTKNAKIFSYILLILAAIFVMLLWRAEYVSAPSFEDESSYNLDIEFIFDKQPAISLQYLYSIEKQENLLTVTENIAQEQGWAIDYQDYGDLGILITNINDQNNGQGQKYWQYYINDTMPMAPVNNYYPKKNDRIKWIFDKSEF
jgi:hypothetical protein